jgi:putative transposase
MAFTPRPHRLEEVFANYAPPLYFVTLCTGARQRVLASSVSHVAFAGYAGNALSVASVAVGRYVIMPDHIHLFLRGPDGFRLGIWVRGLKRSISDALSGQQSSSGLWQTGYFDHIIRNSESYREKWAYVSQNPVRAGLVTSTDEWPYQGEITVIDRA